MPGPAAEQVESLAKAVVSRAGPATRFMVAIAGPPGSGKTTLAARLCDALVQRGERAIVVPMDGFHFDDAVLNARGHRSRKGAPHTFDIAGFEVLLSRIRAQEPDVAIPVFDRHLEAARAGAAIVDADARLILIEGNYLLLKQSPWDRLKPFFDMTVFLNVPLGEIERRLTGRILEHGHDEAYARHWIESNDLPNARLVLTESATADVVLS